MQTLIVTIMCVWYFSFMNDNLNAKLSKIDIWAVFTLNTWIAFFLSPLYCLFVSAGYWGTFLFYLFLSLSKCLSKTFYNYSINLFISYFFHNFHCLFFFFYVLHSLHCLLTLFYQHSMKQIFTGMLDAFYITNLSLFWYLQLVLSINVSMLEYSFIIASNRRFCHF